MISHKSAERCRTIQHMYARMHIVCKSVIYWAELNVHNTSTDDSSRSSNMKFIQMRDATMGNLLLWFHPVDASFV